MFTGLIEATGVVEELVDVDGGARISIRSELAGVIAGESIAVNGICLTIFPKDGLLRADVSTETIERTTIGDLQPGEVVNLERALEAGSRFGGHLVQGHVDTTGRLESISRAGEFAVYRWSIGEAYARLLVDKGSVAIDGISLTVVEPSESQFSAALIPETIERTNLKNARVGDRVNVELDLIAKYVERLIRPYLKT
ncbi:MAG: riboflavin synthase [Acidobacteria bacterium]|nr:riboflavin synthase [Acidobacteriota bacterium]